MEEIENFLLISINRRLDDIFEGKKLWEYRRSPPKNKNIVAIVYDSGKSHSIIGEFFVKDILRNSIDEIIKRTIKETTTPELSLREYFKGIELCSALKIKDPKRYKVKLSLKEIRELIPKFAPPQNFMYVKKDDKRLILLFNAIMQVRSIN